MAIGPSTTLQGSGLATTLNYAVKPGVQSGGNVTELVSNTNKAVSKSAGTTTGSDSDGSYVNVSTSADWCDIAYGRAADGNGFSVVMVLKLDESPPAADWEGLVSVKVDGSNPAFALGNYSESTAADSLEIDLNQFSFDQFFSVRDSYVGPANTLLTLVVTWAGDGTHAKLFTTGGTSPATAFSGQSGQNTGLAPTLVLSSDTGHSLGWPAKHYFFAWSDTTWTDVQAQAVADNVEAQLLSNGGVTYSVSQAEAVSAADSQDASVTVSGGGTTYSVAQAETVTALDLQSASRVAAGATQIFNNTTALNSTALALSLKSAYLLGVPGTLSGSIKDIRQAADRLVTFHGGAVLGTPDTIGNFIDVPSATDWAEIDWNVKPAGEGYSVVMCVRPSNLNPPSFAEMFSLPTDATGFNVFQFGRNALTNDLWEGHNKSENWFFLNGIDYLTAGDFVTLVVTWNGVDQPKLFATGKGAPKVMDSGHPLGPMDGGTPTKLRVANSPLNDGGWIGSYYFFGWSDTTWADEDAQAIADDIAGTLFEAGIGGPSTTITTDLDRVSVLPTNLEVETRSVTVTKLNGIETARRYSRITFPKNSNIIGQPPLVQSVATAAWGSPTPPPSTSPEPAVLAVQGQGYQLTADYTFGTVAGTIRDYPTLWQYFDCLQVDGNGIASLRAINDEWEYYTDPKNGEPYEGVTHIIDTDHIKLRTIKENSTLFDQAVARALATNTPSNPDGHYWGNWDGSQAYDTGIRSANLSTVAAGSRLGGYFEICCKLPDGLASWPGWWMIARGGAWPPEIDMFEIPYNNYDLFLTHHGLAHLHTSKVICGASPFDNTVANRPIKVNTDVQADQGTPGFYSNGTNWRLDYHVIGFEWIRGGDPNGDQIKFWLDQTLIFDGYFPWMDSCANPSPASVFQIQNAYGGDWPGRNGCIPNTVFPVDLCVKYFRCWAK